MKIESGIGNGKWAGVDGNNRLEVRAESFPYQQVISFDEGQAYEVFGTAPIASGTNVVLHIKNTSLTRNCVILFVDFQVIDPAGGTALPNASNYFCIATSRTRSSGGGAVTPTNLKVGSGNVAEVEVFDTNPTLTGGSTQVNRWYPKAEGDRLEFKTDGALMLEPGQTLECSYISDHTSGTVYTEIEFVMEKIIED